MNMNDKQMGIHVKGLIELREARFLSFPPGSEDQQIDIKDSINVSNPTLHGFRLSFTRTMQFHPSAYFEIIVTYQSDVEFEDDAGIAKLKTVEAVKAWADNNVVRIINTFALPSKASLLASNLLQSAGFNPLITQPTCIEHE